MQERPLRILYYGMNFSPELMGVGKYAGELVSHLHDQGFEIDVVTAVPHYPGWCTFPGYKNAFFREHITGVRVTHCPLYLSKQMRGIHRVLAPVTFALFSAPIALWRILVSRPDVVLCAEPTLFAAPIALLSAKLVGARTVLHVQDLEVDAAFAVQHLRGNAAKRIATAFERAMLRGYDAVVTISAKMRQKLLQKGVDSKRLHIVRNWVDTNAIKPLTGTNPLRAAYDIRANDFVVLYAGNLGAKQGLDLIPNIARALADHTDIVFAISGSGPEKDTLYQQCADLANVRFLPVQPPDKLCTLLNLADTHILPQKQDVADLVLPSKLGGMLASGKPCIVMASPGTELYEFLDGVVTLVPPDDVNGSAREILRLQQGAREKQMEDLTVRYARCLREIDAQDNLSQFVECIRSVAKKPQ